MYRPRFLIIVKGARDDEVFVTMADPCTKRSSKMSRLRESTMRVSRRKTDQYKKCGVSKSNSTAIIRSRSLEPTELKSQSPYDYDYNENDCYKGYSKPVGFLDLIDVSMEHRQTIHHLCDQYSLLHSIFCDFPVKMLKILSDFLCSLSMRYF